MSDDLVKQLKERATIAREEDNMTANRDAYFFEKSAVRIEELGAKLAKAEAAIHRIAPYLSASLSELDCGPDYIDACNQVFEADSITLAELTGGKDG